DSERYYASYYSQVEGSYFSSDFALVDADGHFWDVGRSVDVIIVSGHRLSTMAMEGAVLVVARIAAAAAIGVPDCIKGGVAYESVRTDEDYEETKVLHDKIEQSIIHHIGRIAKPDMIIFVTELPKTVSGKIMRRLLREIVATGAVSGDITGLEN